MSPTAFGLIGILFALLCGATVYYWGMRHLLLPWFLNLPGALMLVISVFVSLWWAGAEVGVLIGVERVKPNAMINGLIIAAGWYWVVYAFLDHRRSSGKR